MTCPHCGLPQARCPQMLRWIEQAEAQLREAERGGRPESIRAAKASLAELLMEQQTEARAS